MAIPASPAWAAAAVLPAAGSAAAEREGKLAVAKEMMMESIEREKDESDLRDEWVESEEKEAEASKEAADSHKEVSLCERQPDKRTNRIPKERAMPD